MKMIRHHGRFRVMCIAGIFSAVVVFAGVGGVMLWRQVLHTTTSPSQKIEHSVSLTTFSEIPVRLAIKTINVNAPIVALGLTNTGAMAAPNNNTDIGWYNKSAKAGETAYAMLLDGHKGVAGDWGVLRRLGDVARNDEITVTTEKGKVLTYQVRETETKAQNDVDMERALMPYKNGSQSLTIITCEGTYSKTQDTYDKRIVVYAERIR